MTNDLKVGTFVSTSLHFNLLLFFLAFILFISEQHLHIYIVVTRCESYIDHSSNDCYTVYCLAKLLVAIYQLVLLLSYIQDIIIEFECDIVSSVNSMLSSTHLQFYNDFPHFSISKSHENCLPIT